jgi:hypothetical protein
VQLLIVTIEPVQQVAAEPATLEALTTALLARQTEPTDKPLLPAHAPGLLGWPLVADPGLPSGIVYLRPTPRPHPGILFAPWTPHAVDTLNRFQRESGMHPFTCSADHQGSSPTLIATEAGWECPDDDCTYTQDWAHSFMTIPETWPSASTGIHFPTRP